MSGFMQLMYSLFMSITGRALIMLRKCMKCYMCYMKFVGSKIGAMFAKVYTNLM